MVLRCGLGLFSKVENFLAGLPSFSFSNLKLSPFANFKEMMVFKIKVISEVLVV